MSNRDFFYRERQAGGRTAHDYGHTKLGYPEAGHELRWWHCGLFGAILAAVMIFGSVS